MSSLKELIKAARSRVTRRLFVRRRSDDTGLFESTWQDITKDVIKWGSIKTTIDSQRLNKIKLANARIVVDNIYGDYNPEDDTNSLWYNFAAQQRSLVKIESGYISQTLTGGVWTNTEYPAGVSWDTAKADTSTWTGDGTLFIGVIAGDINLDDTDKITLNVKPLSEVFRQYSAKNLSGYTSTGMTASDFMESVRDHTAGGAYVFRQFFDDTTTNWDIATTTTNYANLDTSGAKDIRDKNVWQVMEKLAEAENYVVWITKKGVFKFQPRTAGVASSFTFVGTGTRDGEFGQTIKRITSFGKRYSKYYSRVEIKHKEADTSTSLEVVETQLVAGGSNNPWYFGERTFSFENTWIATTATANALATAVFDDFSNVKDEIKFTTNFVPQLEILDRVNITYDSNPTDPGSLWDVNNWADTLGAATSDDDLIWNDSRGSAINLVNQEFKLISIEQNLDKFESRFEARRA